LFADEVGGIVGIEADGVGFGVIVMVRYCSIRVTAAVSVEDVVRYCYKDEVYDEHIEESS